jgi:hypothetical protein
MKYSTIILHLIACASVSHAFSPIFSHNKLNSQTSRRVVLFSSQWDDEEEEVTASVATEAATSFDQAGVALRDEDDQKKMDEQGDYDSNPQVS